MYDESFNMIKKYIEHEFGSKMCFGYNHAEFCKERAVYKNFLNVPFLS